MSFSAWAQFFQMGGHGLYVWSAYAIGLLVLLLNACWPFFARRRFLRNRRLEQARRQRRESFADEGKP